MTKAKRIWFTLIKYYGETQSETFLKQNKNLNLNIKSDQELSKNLIKQKCMFVNNNYWNSLHRSSVCSIIS